MYIIVYIHVYHSYSPPGDSPISYVGHPKKRASGAIQKKDPVAWKEVDISLGKFAAMGRSATKIPLVGGWTNSSEKHACQNTWRM